MNIDPSTRENSDQTSTWSENLAINLGHVRSYRCSFCKRGFSNAQALGGHMNIHRKDRAKLREFSDENLLSLDISKTTDFCGDHSPSANSSTSEETRKPGCDHGKVDDLDHDVVPSSEENSMRRLPLFAEAPTVIDDDDGDHKHIEKSKMELIHGEVDLELRLGPEPHDAKINQ